MTGYGSAGNFIYFETIRRPAYVFVLVGLTCLNQLFEVTIRNMDKRLNLLYAIPLGLAFVTFLLSSDILFTAGAFLAGLGILYLIRGRFLPPHVDRAARLFRSGRLQEALVAANAAIEARPESWEGYYLRALTYYDLNQLDDAAADARRAIELKPEEATTHAILCQVYYWQNRYDEAQLSFAKAAELNKRDPMNHYWLGATLFQQGEYGRAIPRLELSAGLKMPNQQLELLTYYYLGTALEAEGHVEDAQFPFKKMAKLDKVFAALEQDVRRAPESPGLPRLRQDVTAIRRRLTHMGAEPG